MDNKKTEVIELTSVKGEEDMKVNKVLSTEEIIEKYAGASLRLKSECTNEKFEDKYDVIAKAPVDRYIVKEIIFSTDKSNAFFNLSSNAGTGMMGMETVELEEGLMAMFYITTKEEIEKRQAVEEAVKAEKEHQEEILKEERKKGIKVSDKVMVKDVCYYNIPATAKVIEIGDNRVKVILTLDKDTTNELNGLVWNITIPSKYIAYSTCHEDDKYDYAKGYEIAIRKAYRKLMSPIEKYLLGCRDYRKTCLDKEQTRLNETKESYEKIRLAYISYFSHLRDLEREIREIDEDGLIPVKEELIEVKTIEPNTGEVITKKVTKEQYDKIMSIMN